MAEYRLFFLDSKGHIFSREDLNEVADDEALHRAKEVRHIYNVEVWQGDRMVGIIEPMRPDFPEVASLC